MSNRVNLTLDVTKTGIQNPLIKVRQGDGGFETLRTTVTSNGEPLDLQGWTVTFMGTTAGNHKIVDTNVTVVEAPNGIFDYTPSKAWGMDIGEFKIAYFKFVKGDGTASSANFRVNVIEAVDLTQEEAQNYISIVDATIAEAKEHLESSLASISSSVADTSSAVGSLSVSISNTASSAVSQINSAAYNVSSVATSAVNNVSSVASSAVNNINSAADVYVKKSGTETIDGDKTFTRPINGALSTRYATFTDFNDVARNMVKYSGSWLIGTQSIANSPLQNYYTATITPGFGDGGSGYIELVPFVIGSASKYIAVVGSQTLSPWKSFSFDDNVVHKTGTETIAGDKTFSGSISFSGNVNLNAYIKKSNELPAIARDFGYLAQHMQEYQGFWWNGVESIANAPADNWTWSVIEVIPGSAGSNGVIRTMRTSDGIVYSTNVNFGYVQHWTRFADDANVVHNTGNETVAGDKTFTGKVTANDLVSNSVPVNFTKTTTSKMWYNSTLTASRTGNIVTIVNSKIDTSVIEDNTTSTETIPAGYRPSTVLFYPAVFGPSLRGELQINTDGTFTARGTIDSRYRVTATYITGDAWPV